uniref:ABC transporter domain-containing protein n=1 Tax=Attheya septentrionalis TaxID=420275 RepID=A0A7S2UBS7_9STRA|mmetsp:Transcript_18931/g.34325  ORF Transcript_18931/g.34325 Transcript_18931/m.34325 type:complete len:1474 (+) Transcript_18931:271-4692(+)
MQMSDKTPETPDATPFEPLEIDTSVAGESANDDDMPPTSSEEKNRDDFVLSFEHLTVHVPGIAKNTCFFNVDNPIANYMQEYLGMQMQEREPFYSIDNVSGHIKAGEVCLVLGPNDSNKATLLRALCGRLNTQDELYGTILLNGMPMGPSNQGWRRLSPYVSASDASHSPVLTVKETLTFAAQCHSTGSPEKIDEDVEKIMVALGIDHVAETVVGDENLRGISGGQKRRVTVGEMFMDPDGKFYCLEQITDGLASSDSLSLIEKLTNSARLNRDAAFVSLLQPSDEMIMLFDKILVLTASGEQAYFGPVDRTILRDIFLGPTADASEDSGSIADLVLKKGLSGSFSGEDSVVKRFAESPVGDELALNLARIRTSAPPSRDRDLDSLLPDKKYSTSRWYQLKIISARRRKLIFRNSVTYSRIAIAIVFGLIIGSLFSSLKNDAIGSLARTGYLFLNSFLVLMLSAAVTIPSSFRERVTLFKLRSAEFFSGRVFYIAQVLTDAPLSILEAILLSSISYFWVDMNSGANHFFYFLGTMIGLECVGQALGRLLCALFRKQVTANACSSVAILLCGTVGGFMPAYGSIPTILRWFSWFTPVSYAFEGMMINEFYGRELSGVIIGTEDGDVSLASISGSAWLSNFDLPRQSFASANAIKIFDLGMLFVFAMVYDLLGLYFIERTRQWYHNQTRRPQATVKYSFDLTPDLDSPAAAAFRDIKSHNSKTKPVDDGEKLEQGQIGSSSTPDLDSPAAAALRDSKSHNSETKPVDEGDKLEKGQIGSTSTLHNSTEADWPQTLSVKNLSYTVPLKSKYKMNVKSKVQSLLLKACGRKMAEVDKDESESLTLLQGVDALFRRSRMCALMGTSGAGKSTFMDVVAGYKTGGQITGDIMIDGIPKDTKTWKHIMGYAEQNDILNPYLSVLETLRFTASCRLHRDVDREARVQEVIELMGLADYAKFVVGRELEGEGLPKHARKRLTIAVQLVIRPKVLFLDEPTTGLGNNDAALVIEAVRRSTDAMGIITLATIHQPSKHIWDTFDDALLLAKGGRVIYMGEMGPKSETVMSYFSSLTSSPPPAQCNPADYILGTMNDLEPMDAEKLFKQSSHNDLLAKSIGSVVKSGFGDEPQIPPSVHMRGPNSPVQEFFLLTKRHLIAQWRNPSYSFMRITSSIGVSLYMGILFSGSDISTLSGAVNSIGAIFFLVFVLVIPMQAAVVPLIEDRAVLYRETVSGTYSRLSYGLGQLAADLPFHLLNTILMFIFFYFLVDFQRKAEEMGYFLLMLFLSNWVIQSLGQLFALATPNEESANGLAGLSIILSVILMGFLITVNAMPAGWTWAYWSNLFHYILQGLVTNELVGRTYSLDLNLGVPDNITNASNLVFFNSGVDPMDTTSHQVGNLVSLTALTGGGINPDTPLGDLSALVDCLVENDCLVEPIADNFIPCIFQLFGTAPCEVRDICIVMVRNEVLFIRSIHLILPVSHV